MRDQTRPLTGEALAFDPVWLVLKRPRPNADPSSFFAPGKLTFDGRNAAFSPSSAKLSFPFSQTRAMNLTLGTIVAVDRERYGWGLVPRLVAIRHESDAGTIVTYFNDSGWRGWRPLLTGSNRRMVRAIQQHLGLHS